LREYWPRSRADMAHNLRDATEQLKSDGYDLVILDLQMDDARGLEAVVACREHSEAPILACGCHSEDQFAMMVMQAGAAGYISKHRNEEEFIRAVRRILSGRRYVSEHLAESLVTGGRRSQPHPPHLALSPQENRVLLLLGQGIAGREIATHMAISAKTVSTYRARILEKLGIGNSAELVRYCLEHKLVE